MDNRVTRKRLSDFLAYEWIFVIIICVLSIVVWELVYMVGEVRLTVGQNFKFYYDQTIDNKDGKLYSLISDKSISYDILSLDYELLSEKYNVLSSRLVLKEGDILITDCKQDYTQPEDGSQPQPLQVRLKSAVDNLYGYSFNQMLIDAQTYLRDNFIKDDKKAVAFDGCDYDNLDQDKIALVFRNRMKKDNRFRTEVQIQNGIELEKGRVQKLYKEVIDFQKLLSLKDSKPDLFFIYTKGEQNLQFADDRDKPYYQSIVKNEENSNRKNNIYALKVNALATQGKTDPSTYFTMNDKQSAEDVCIMAFNFRSAQPHLQYECICFINTIVRECSDLLD